MLRAIPTLENIDSAGVNRIDCLNEVEAAGCLRGKPNRIAVRCREGSPIRWIYGQASGDYQHGSKLRSFRRLVHRCPSPPGPWDVLMAKGEWAARCQASHARLVPGVLIAFARSEPQHGHPAGCIV